MKFIVNTGRAASSAQTSLAVAWDARNAVAALSRQAIFTFKEGLVIRCGHILPSPPP
jgi:hypothetical protein